MNETMTLEVTTFVYGLGATRYAPPVYVVLPEQTMLARDLIAEHVRAEIAAALKARSTSLALHYILADNLRELPCSSSVPALDVEAEVARAWNGLSQRRYLLVVDGLAIHDLDTRLSITARSQVSFVRLLPLIGG